MKWWSYLKPCLYVQQKGKVTLKSGLTRNVLCQEILDLRPSAHVNQFNFFTYIGKYVFPGVQYLIRPS